MLACADLGQVFRHFAALRNPVRFHHRCQLLLARVDVQAQEGMAKIAQDAQHGQRDLNLRRGGLVRVLRPLQAAECTYRIAFGPRASQKVLTVQGAMPREKDFKQTLCADIDGFSLHAAVRCAAQDRQALAQLCRHITRPALANGRMQAAAAGQVMLELKTALRDGTAHLVMSPLEFMARMAALVHRHRLHLIRFHGVLARATASGRPIHDGECRQRVDSSSSPAKEAAVRAARK